MYADIELFLLAYAHIQWYNQSSISLRIMEFQSHQQGQTEEFLRLPEEGRQQTYIRWLRQRASRSTFSQESYEHAWEVAREAARLLRERHGADRVRVFGSLLHEGRFHPGSDIDLAVEGLKSSEYWSALTSVMFLDDQVRIEMVDRNTCRPEIWDVVEAEGIEL